MEMNENLVTEVAENVEQTTEETQQAEKTYTQSEVDVIVGKAKARTKAKVSRDFERKYGGLTDVLRAGTGKQSVEELTDTFTDFYTDRGIEIRKPNEYSDKDIETLARVEADEIIASGIEEVIEEADRLADIGADKMTAKEKAVFRRLTDYAKDTEKNEELAKIGVPKEVYESKAFKDYAAMFNPNIPISVIYDNYNKTQPRKEIKPMGSMKNTSADSGVKEFYTPEEAKRFTQDEINNNPALFAAIERSMKKWR